MGKITVTSALGWKGNPQPPSHLLLPGQRWQVGCMKRIPKHAYFPSWTDSCTMKAFPRRMSCSGQKLNTTMGRPGPVLPFRSVSLSLFFSDIYNLPSCLLWSLVLWFWIILQNWKSAETPPDLLPTRLSRRQAITCPSTVTTAGARLALVSFPSLRLLPPVCRGHFWKQTAWASQSLLFTQVEAQKLSRRGGWRWFTQMSEGSQKNTLFLSLTFLLVVREAQFKQGTTSIISTPLLTLSFTFLRGSPGNSRTSSETETKQWLPLSVVEPCYKNKTRNSVVTAPWCYLSSLPNGHTYKHCHSLPVSVHDFFFLKGTHSFPEDAHTMVIPLAPPWCCGTKGKWNAVILGAALQKTI